VLVTSFWILAKSGALRQLGPCSLDTESACMSTVNVPVTEHAISDTPMQHRTVEVAVNPTLSDGQQLAVPVLSTMSAAAAHSKCARL